MHRDSDDDRDRHGGQTSLTTPEVAPTISVALLTGGSDRPYVFGLATSLLSKGAALDLIGSDELDCAECSRRATGELS